MGRKRQTFSKEFKAKVALDGVHPNQISQWKAHAIAGIAEQNNTRLKTTDHRFNLQAIASLNETGNLNIIWKVNSLYDFDSYTGNPSIDSTRVTKLSFQGLTLTIDDGLSSYLTTVGPAQEFYTEAQWGCTK